MIIGSVDKTAETQDNLQIELILSKTYNRIISITAS